MPSQDGQVFDAGTEVLDRAYPMCPYDPLPSGGTAGIADDFERNVDHERGDAMLLVGRLDAAIDRYAPTCDRLLGWRLEQLVDHREAL